MVGGSCIMAATQPTTLGVTVFKSIARRELTASNGNTVRFDIGPDGSVKIAARKGTHNQSVSVLAAEDIPALIAWLTGEDN